MDSKVVSDQTTNEETEKETLEVEKIQYTQAFFQKFIETFDTDKKSSTSLSCDSQLPDQKLFDSQIFFNEFQKYMLDYGGCRKTKSSAEVASVAASLLIQKDDQPDSGWFVRVFHHAFSASGSDLHLRSLHCALKLPNYEIVVKVYNVLLNHQLMPTEDDLCFARSHLQDKDFEIFERILLPLKEQQILQFEQPFFKKLISANKFHLGGIYCSSMLDNDDEIIDLLCMSKMNKKNMKKFLHHLKYSTKFSLLKNIVTNGHGPQWQEEWLFQLVYKTVKSNVTNDQLVGLIKTKPSFFWENSKIFYKLLEDDRESICTNELGNLFVSAMVEIEEPTCLGDNEMDVLLHLLKSGRDLTVIQFSEYDTPVHAAAMLSLKTVKKNCALLQYVLDNYQFPENGEVLNQLNESPYHSVLKAQQQQKLNSAHVRAVCKCLSDCNKINPYFMDHNQNQTIDFSIDDAAKRLINQVEEAWDKRFAVIDTSSTPNHQQQDINEIFEESQSETSSFVKEIGDLLDQTEHNDFHFIPQTEKQVDTVSDPVMGGKLEQEVESNDWLDLDDDSSDDENNEENDAFIMNSDNLDETEHVPFNEEVHKFNDFPWEVLISKQASDFLKAKKNPNNVIEKIEQKLYQIASGDRTRSVIRRALQPEDKLYETKILKSARILWQESIEYSEKRGLYMDVVKVLWISLRHNKTQLNDRIQQAKNALKKSRTCNAKILQIIDNQQNNDPSKCLPRTFKLPNVPQIQIQPTPRCCPTPNLFDGEFSVMQFHHFPEFLQVLRSDNPSERECPIRMSEEEHSIIKLPYKLPILLCGRSGTGKTTTCLYRLWNRFILSLKNISSQSHVEHDRPHLRQVFLTKSPVLCSKLNDQFDKLLAGRCAMSSSDGFPEASNFTRNLIIKKICRFVEINDKHFPIFLTSRQFFLLLDASLDASKEPFFPKNGRGELRVKITNCVYDDNADCNALFEDIEKEIETDLNPNNSTPQLEEWTEITADFFCNKIWILSDFQPYHKNFDPLIVWTEIQSFIKGSVLALKSKSGFLTFEQYSSQFGKKQAPMFFDDQKKKSQVYDCFLKYEKFKKDMYSSNHYFDENDFIFHVYRRLISYKKADDRSKREWHFDNFYIDEIQDFTQSELCTILACSDNIKETFCTGDVAQTIMKGVHFRFEDLKNQFWELTNCRPGMESETNLSKPKESPSAPVPELRYLEQNYRSHSGILNLGHSILNILRNKKYFPFSYLDSNLSQEKAVFTGPKPILLDTTSPSELVNLMLGSGHDGEAIHELGAHQAIIVRSKEEKDSLPDTIKDGIVLTVLESKGLEFDDVLLYNFFSGLKNHTEDTIPWNLLYELINDENTSCHQDEPKESFDNKQRRILKTINVQIHPFRNDEKRLRSFAAELKHLYTAITRSKKNLWIYEEKVNLKGPVFYYWLMKDLAKLVKFDSLCDTDLIFAASSENEQWEKQGDFFLKRKNWEQAIKCYEKAQKRWLGNLAKGYMLIENEVTAVQLSGRVSHPMSKSKEIMAYTEAALYFLKAGIETRDGLYFKRGSMCLLKAGLHEEAARAFESLKEYKIARNEWLKAKKYSDAARLEEQLHNFSNAVRYLLDACEHEKALEKALEFEESGENLELDVSSQQVANQIFKLKLSRGEAEENLKSIANFIEDGHIKAVFLQQIGLVELAVDALIKEKKIEDAYSLLKQKGLFSLKGAKTYELPLDQHEEFLYLCFMQMCKQKDWRIDENTDFPNIQELVTASRKIFINFSYALAKCSIVEGTKERTCLEVLCKDDLNVRENPHHGIAQLNFYWLLMDTRHAIGFKKYFQLAREAYEIAEIFEGDISIIGSNKNLVQAMEFYSFEVFDDFSFSIPSILMDFFFRDDIEAKSKDKLRVIEKGVMYIALKNHLLKLSKAFLESEAAETHMCTIQFTIQSAYFYRDLCSQSANALSNKYLSDHFLEAVKTTLTYWELSQCVRDSEFKKAIVNLFAPCAAYYGKINFSILRNSTLACKSLIKIANEMIYKNTASLDDFLLAWRIIHTLCGSAKAREIISPAMQSEGIHTISYNDRTIHIFNGWLVSARQLQEGKVSNSIWSMYNYILTRVAQIRDNTDRSNALSVQSITYTVSTIVVSLMSMIVLTSNSFFVPQFLVPDCYFKLIENHDAVHYEHHNSVSLLNLSSSQVFNERHNWNFLVNRSFRQLKILLKFLTGQDENRYNVLHQALSSTVSIEDGSGFLCLNLCLILVTNLLTNCKNDKEELQDILFIIHETIHACRLYGRKHFTDIAHEDLKIARKTSDLYRLILRLFHTKDTSISLQKLQPCNDGRNVVISCKYADPAIFPNISIKSLVMLRVPSSSNQTSAAKQQSNDDDAMDEESAAQQLLNDIDATVDHDSNSIPETNNSDSPCIKNNFCTVCGCTIKEVNHLQLDSHKKAQEELNEFKKQEVECVEFFKKLSSEMKTLQMYVKVASLITECDREVERITKIGIKTRNNYSWKKGLELLNLGEISKNILRLKESYSKIKIEDNQLQAELKNKQEATNESTLVAETDILPDNHLKKRVLKKPNKRKN